MSIESRDYWRLPDEVLRYALQLKREAESSKSLLPHQVEVQKALSIPAESSTKYVKLSSVLPNMGKKGTVLPRHTNLEDQKRAEMIFVHARRTGEKVHIGLNTYHPVGTLKAVPLDPNSGFSLADVLDFPPRYVCKGGSRFRSA